MAPSVPPRCWGMTEGFTLAFILILAATIGPVHAENSFDEHQNELCNIVDELQFSGTKANQTVQWQVDIGPRTPGSQASALLRANFTAEAERLGYIVSESNHTSHGIEFTNLFARWVSSSEDADQLVLSAHYDSRNIADQDRNETNRSMPVPGANDAASGAAVLLELARLIPSMNLSYDESFSGTMLKIKITTTPKAPKHGLTTSHSKNRNEPRHLFCLTWLVMQTYNCTTYNLEMTP